MKNVDNNHYTNGIAIVTTDTVNCKARYIIRNKDDI